MVKECLKNQMPLIILVLSITTTHTHTKIKATFLATSNTNISENSATDWESARQPLILAFLLRDVMFLTNLKQKLTHN